MRAEGQRLAALGLLAAGESVRRVAAQLGVPKSTVADWKAQFAEGYVPEITSTTKVAGLCVKAADTGRVLMIQRSSEDPSDPAGGLWEFPGGHLEDGEEALDGAKREWSEETGAELPAGKVKGSWLSGVYEGFVYLVGQEQDVDVNADPAKREVLNPDDPDSDHIEVAAWWNPEHLPQMPALRPEVRGTDWSAVARAEFAEDYPKPKPQPRGAGYPEDQGKATPSPASTAELAIQVGQRAEEAEPGDVAAYDQKYVAPPTAEEAPEAIPTSNEPEWNRPAVMDKVYWSAVMRYVNLVNNDVRHSTALDAAQKIDPDFDIDMNTVVRLYDILGKLDEAGGPKPANFGGPGPGSIEPPDYVKTVYDRWELGGQAETELESYVYDTMVEAYLEGINAQLTALGIEPETSITDQAILDELSNQARLGAAGIADTYNRELANETYTAWIELRSSEGRQASEAKLSEMVEQWAEERADWKGEQIALSEASSAFALAVSDFLSHNNADGQLATHGYIDPEDAECEECEAWTSLGVVDLDTLDSFEPPHPGCPHEITVIYDTDALETPEDLWSGQEEAEAA